MFKNEEYSSFLNVFMHLVLKHDKFTSFISLFRPLGYPIKPRPSRMYARDTSRIRKVRTLCRRLRIRFVNLYFCLRLFFFAHLPQISIVLDI